jgi:KDO2-lipid IV(A) lauroyltransferase
MIVLPFLRALAWSFYLMPSRLRGQVGASIGFLLRALSFRSKVVRENLAYAFPGPGREGERAKVFGQAYTHLGRLFSEILLLLGPMRRFAIRYGELKGLENWKAARQSGRGVLFLSSHVGNWEVMSAIGALSGIDLMLVTKHLKPEWLHQAIERGRASCGVGATYEPRTFRDVLAHLKRNGTVGFVLDQYAGPPVGVRVPVFGVPVGTQTAVALLAKRTGAAVVPVVNYRVPGGRYVVEIRPALPWIGDPDPGREIAVNTARYAELLEADVRAHPGQWLWTHRRFKGDLSPLRPEEWSEGRARR